MVTFYDHGPDLTKPPAAPRVALTIKHSQPMKLFNNEDSAVPFDVSHLETLDATRLPLAEPDLWLPFEWAAL